jgi:hypothetical protein
MGKRSPVEMGVTGWARHEDRTRKPKKNGHKKAQDAQKKTEGRREEEPQINADQHRSEREGGESCGVFGVAAPVMALDPVIGLYSDLC